MFLASKARGVIFGVTAKVPVHLDLFYGHLSSLDVLLRQANAGDVYTCFP
jgi:hypothetical protein